MISSKKSRFSLAVAGCWLIGLSSALAGLTDFGAGAEAIQAGAELHRYMDERFNLLEESTATALDHGELPQFASLEATNSSSAALTVISASSRLTLAHRQSITLSGSPGETVTLSLRHLVLQDNSTLNLQGTATTTFVIRVRNDFCLYKNSQILLSGGLLPTNVVFHVRGKGNKVILNKQTTIEGILIAHHRKVRLSGHATMIGQVSARKLRLRDHSQIIPPPLVSP